MLQYFNPLAWGRWFGQFFYFWAVSVNWKEAPRTIPAIIVMMVLGVSAAIVYTGESDWRSRLLDQQFATAWTAEDYTTAELVIRRKMEGQREDSDLLFRLAMAREKQDNVEEAAELMRKLVATKEYEDAARWLLSEEYVGKKWSDLTIGQRKEFGELLALINRESPNDVGIQQLYADYLIASDRLDKAVPLLDSLARVQPMRGLQCAAILRKMGDMAAADRRAERTLERVSELSEEEPTNTVLALAVAQNQLFLHRYADAVKTLDRSIRLSKSKEDALRLNQAMGDSIVAWVTYIQEESSDSKTIQRRVLKMLQTALRYAPNNPRVLTLVADQVLATLGDDDDEVTQLRDALVDGSSPAIAHFIQGTSALMADDLDKATMHLKIASELMPRSGAILNNLAVAISMRGEAGLDQALKLSETAIETTPNATPHFYETRGQILTRMGRYLDAVPDLERALAVEALQEKAHESLAKCYKELGDEALSKRHAEAADKIANAPKEPAAPDTASLVAPESDNVDQPKSESGENNKSDQDSDQ
tara:strand:- start:242296 stop:243900 length:1605 start_codon:yes stop_codon:yes gene_type:complete